MSLAGYPSHYYTDITSFHVPASPNLDTVFNGSNDQMLNNFMNHLFNVREKHFTIGGKLRPLLECLFATIIMYHEEILTKYGALHVISKAVIRSAKEFKVADKALEEWGRVLKSDWRIRNTKPSMNNNEISALMGILVAQNEMNAKAHARQELKIAIAIEEVQDLRKTVERYEGMLKDIIQQSVETPNKKRKAEVCSYLLNNIY